MAALLDRPVGKKKSDPDAPKKHSWPQRKPFFQGVALYRDVAEWAADIAAHATRELKKGGVIEGRQQISQARVIDPFIREVLWTVLWRLRHEQAGNPRAPIPPTPPPPEPPVELGLPG